MIMENQMNEKRIFRYDSLDSTNTETLKMIVEKDLPEYTVITAREQTSGRGQEDNTWESEPGMNLTFSMVLYPRFLDAGMQFRLSKVLALAVWKTVSDILLQSPVTIKWPNDIYIGDRKVAGILIQNSILGQVLETSIAGIGLNVNQRIFRSGAPNPVSLSMASGKEYDLELVLDQLIANIERYYKLLKSGRYDEIDSLYFDKLYRKNVMSNFRKDGEIIQARIKGLSEYGHLLLETTDGLIVEAEIKEIEFII
jgi:BirA family transcriptional regulator, biotin operon repressor / biotin---[acetyl-CoA-carboxylase] ligase